MSQSFSKSSTKRNNKQGGLGSELEDIKYKEVEVKQDFEEVQVEDINMNDYSGIQDSFVNNENLYGQSFVAS
jgi:hypothetical protein